MKNKCIAKFLLIVLLIIAFLGFYNVSATDVDPITDGTDGQTSNEGEGADEDETPEDQEEWANFANAKFELKRVGTSSVNLEIAGATLPENASYYLLVTSNSSEPSINDFTQDNQIVLNYSKEANILKTYYFAKYIELNQDIYVNIKQSNNDGSGAKVVSYGIKIDRLSEPKYFDAFSATFVAYNSDQIVTNFIHSSENHRNMQIKIGKVTDKSILKKIKDNNSTGFSDLLKFAHSNTAIYDKVVSTDQESGSIKYSAGTAGRDTEHSLINLPGLVNGDYYYLYIKTDDENGKYISNEAVTLAQAGVYESSGAWYLFFYGSADFNWSDFGEDTPADPTTAGGTIPNAGANITLWTSIVLVIILGTVFSYIQYKKNKF